MVRSRALRFAWFAPPLLLVIAASSLLGPGLPGWDEIASLDAATPYWRFRVPRTVLAAVVGAGLAVGGAIFQALFRNPLAEPYTLGVASGAALGAAIGFYFGLDGRLGGLPVRSGLALAGAAGAMGLVYLMARLRAGRDMQRLLLAGVCVAYASAAGILLTTFLADRSVTGEIVVWLMGSLGQYRPAAGLEVGLALLLLLAFALYSHRALDLLWLGDQWAAARGVAVGRTVWASFVLVGLLTTAVVANCGPIGFVGLMVPHMARAIFGVRTLPLVLGAALLGAAFLCLCDGAGRTVLSVIYGRPIGYEFPVGVLTNILGAGFFFFLLARSDGPRVH